MNLWIVGLLIAIAALCEASERKVNPEAKKRQEFLATITMECAEELKFDLDSGMKLLLGNFSIDSNEAKCFLHCVFRKEGFLNDNDEPQIDAIVRTLGKPMKLRGETFSKIIGKCAKQKNEGPCDLAFKLWKCFLDSQGHGKRTEL